MCYQNRYVSFFHQVCSMMLNWLAQSICNRVVACVIVWWWYVMENTNQKNMSLIKPSLSKQTKFKFFSPLPPPPPLQRQKTCWLFTNVSSISWVIFLHSFFLQFLGFCNHSQSLACSEYQKSKSGHFFTVNCFVPVQVWRNFRVPPCASWFWLWSAQWSSWPLSRESSRRVCTGGRNEDITNILLGFWIFWIARKYETHISWKKILKNQMPMKPTCRQKMVIM